MKTTTARASDTILLAALVLFAFFVVLTRLTNYDLWVHLATGRYIVETGFRVTDPFNYTQPGAGMYLGSWLFGVVAYLIWLAGGAAALTVAKALVTAALFLLLIGIARRRDGGHPAFSLVTATALVIAGYALKFRLFFRPHLFELLLLPAALWILTEYRHRPRRCALLLGLLQVLWVNIHGSFLLGFGLPLLFLATDLLEKLLGHPTPPARRLIGGSALIFSALTAATLVNPLGPYLFSAPLAIGPWRGDLLNLGEYQPARLVSLTGPMLRYTWGYLALAAAGASGLLAATLRGRRRPLHEALLFTLFLSLPFVAGLRFIAEFAVVAAPLAIAWWLAALPSAAPRRINLAPVRILAAVALAPLWWATIYSSPIYQVGLGEKLDKFPARAVDFLTRTQPAGPLYNSLRFGGYLTWRLPRYPVFIDGRAPVYPRAFYRLYRRAHEDAEAWQEIEGRYHPALAMIEYLTDITGREGIPALENSPRWALVYWDPVAKIYARRGAGNDAWIARYEYRIARPDRFRVRHLLKATRGARRKQQGAAEYQRALQDNGRNAEAMLGLAFLSAFGPGPDFARALELAERADALHPGRALPHAIACRAHAGRGELATARSACKRALAIDPHNTVARWVTQLILPRATG